SQATMSSSESADIVPSCKIGFREVEKDRSVIMVCPFLLLGDRIRSVQGESLCPFMSAVILVALSRHSFDGDILAFTDPGRNSCIRSISLSARSVRTPLAVELIVWN